MSSWATCTWKGWSHTKKTEEDQRKTGSDATNTKEKGSDVIGSKGEGDKAVDKSDTETSNGEILRSTERVTNNGDNNETSQINDLTASEQCREKIENTEASPGPDSDVDDHEEMGNDSINNR